MANVAEWRVRYVEVRGGWYVYLGRQWIGTVKQCPPDSTHRYTRWVGYINLPGIVGPVADGSDAAGVKVDVTIKVREWMSTLSEEPRTMRETPDLRLKSADGQVARRARRLPQPSSPDRRERRVRAVSA